VSRLTIPLWGARLLGLAGFLDAAYLTVSHYAGTELACGPAGGCEVVTTSRFATVGGIPIALVGAVYYAIVVLLAWTPGDRWGRGTALVLAGITGLATAVSGVLVWLQAAVIHAWCRFCLGSAATTLLLFLCALALTRAASRHPAPNLRPETEP